MTDRASEQEEVMRWWWVRWWQRWRAYDRRCLAEAVEDMHRGYWTGGVSYE